MNRALLGLLLLSLAQPATAQELRIGMKAAVDNSDPHLNYSPNRNIQMQVYEGLAVQDENLRPQPALAESWRLVEPTVWEFKLREGVTFHDGTPLTAQDIAFSFQRARDIQGARTYGPMVRSILAVEPVDARTVRLRTREPAPMLLSYVAVIAVVSAKAAVDADEAAFNGGRAAQGTGPYRWVRFTPGRDVVLERNDRYWGQVEPWSRVTFRFIPNDSSRVAALLAGDVDVVDAVPAALYDRLRGDARTRLTTALSQFNLYMYFDSFRDSALFVTDNEGRRLDRNPMKDRRVRLAISHAINRQALAERAMEGGAEPSGQIVPEGGTGYDPELKPISYDPALSRRLLAEAGYPDGFGLTIHCTNDRFAGDARVCQAIGQMLTAVGIRTTVEALPSSVYFRRANGGAGGEPEFTVPISMYSSSTGLSVEAMSSILRTPNATLGHGALNRGRYSDPVLDGLLTKVETTFDDAERENLMRQAARRAMDEQGVAPIFFVKSAWGTRAGFTLTPRMDQYTLATGIRRAN